MAFAYSKGANQWLSFETLKEHREALVHFVAERPFAAPFTYILIYTVAIALSIPGAVFLTLSGGFLFAQPQATLYSLIGATTGAVSLYFVAQTTLGVYLAKGAGNLLKKMESGFKENQVSYLLFLRLVPAFPFWLVNLAPAFFGVPLRTFAWTTFVGIIPGTFVFSQAGAGIGSILDSGQELSLATVFNTDIKIALCALGLFALVPIAIKKWRQAPSK